MPVPMQPITWYVHSPSCTNGPLTSRAASCESLPADVTAADFVAARMGSACGDQHCSHIYSPVTSTLQSQLHFSHNYIAVTSAVQSQLHCSQSYIAVRSTLQSHLQSSHIYIAVTAALQLYLQSSHIYIVTSAAENFTVLLAGPIA